MCAFGGGINAAIRSARKSGIRGHSRESVVLYFNKLALELCVRAAQGLTHYQILFSLPLFRVISKFDNVAICRLPTRVQSISTAQNASIEFVESTT